MRVWRLSVLALVGALSLVVSSLAATAANNPSHMKLSVWSNDYPLDPDEPDQHWKGVVKEVGSSSFRLDITLSHLGVRLDIPKDLKELARMFEKEVWLEHDVSCLNFFDRDDGVSAVVAAQITDTGWMDPDVFGGFPQFYRDEWVAIEFFDGGRNGDGDWFRIGQGDLDPSLPNPAPPFTEERAVEVCESGVLPADGTGEELCYGPGEVVIDGVTYGPWGYDEEGEAVVVCESWRTTNEFGTGEGGTGLFFDGDIRIY